MTTSLCKASEKKLARVAERVAERLREGDEVYQCSQCCRLSHKTDNVCECRRVSVNEVEEGLVKEMEKQD